MRALKTSELLVISAITVAFIGVCLILAPQVEVKAEETALYSPGITVSKQFIYKDLNPDVKWKDKDWYLEGLCVKVYKKDCWNYIGTFVTNETGWIEIEGLPAGCYAFVWYCGCRKFTEIRRVGCWKQHWIFINEIEPKGEQRATSSLSIGCISYPGFWVRDASVFI